MSISQTVVAPDDLEVRAIAAERLTFFADAVIAIAITLLALELPVPSGATNAAVLRSVGEHRDEYIAFLISFAVIGTHWSGHHRVFRWVISIGGRLSRLTICWLARRRWWTPSRPRCSPCDGAFPGIRFVFYAVVQAAAADWSSCSWCRESKRERLFLCSETAAADVPTP